MSAKTNANVTCQAGDGRTDFLSRASVCVVKVGSGVLTGPDGLNLEVIASLARDIAALMEDGRQVILVSSGAVASGMRKLGLAKKPSLVREKQATAAVGQGALIRQYEKAFETHGRKVAQILLTRYDLVRRVHYLNARNTLKTLLSWGILPIINENDTVAVDELKFGDNDNLSAMIAHLLDADLWVNLTDIDGLYTADPRVNKHAKRLETVANVDRSVEDMADAAPGAVNTGGMASKVAAAKKVTQAGIPAVIASGKNPGTLPALLAGESVGTFFVPRAGRMKSRKCWIAYALKPKGELFLDAGAADAVTKKGKSLLPIGIVAVSGDFKEGDPVEIKDPSGETIAVGLSSFPADDVRAIMGKPSREIARILGEKLHDEVVHRDNLAVTCI
ncbi:MAG: glutamate 5-kinase [Thermodesulfobacteriota bacterium]